jgi:hypothetical protein
MAYRGSRSLTVLSVVMLGLLLVCVAGLILDDRTLGGVSVWLKPAKFAISFVVYALTLGWLIAHLSRGKRTAQRIANVIVVMSILEVGAIAFQAIRGRASHFNEATPLDAWLWQSMGMFIMVLWAGTLLIAILLWREKMPDRAGAWSIRLGMLLLLAGLLQGFFMVVPTEAQIELDERGVETLMGAHSVGVPDGGPGMPLTGWSMTGGDLRIGHFVGIHGLQAILLFTMLLPGLVKDAVRRVRLVFVFACAYAGVLILVTWQALRGQPLLRPDSVTLIAGGLLLGLAGLAAAYSWLRPAPVAE